MTGRGPVERAWTRHVQAWRGGGSIPSGSASAAPPEGAAERLAFALLLSGLLDACDLRRARWLSRDTSESVLLLLLLARLRRGHGSALAADLASDLDTACALPLAALAGTSLASVPAALAANRAALATALGEAIQRASTEGCAPGTLVRTDTTPRGLFLSFARPHDAESRLARRLLDRIRHAAQEPAPSPAALSAILERAPTLHPAQADAVRAALECRTVVVSGGPGTGKTTVVARILEALSSLGEGFSRESTALCAPTGRAKARLQESIARSLPGWGELPAFTLHSLLGARPDGGFRHDAGNPLPYSTVVVDESSMIDLALFAGLLDALRPSTRLVLLGDPDQLPSVEAGAVFGDLVDALRERAWPGARHAHLVFTHRNDGDIRLLAEEVNRGEAESVKHLESLQPTEAPDLLASLRSDPPGTVRWIGGTLEEALALWWRLHPPAGAGDPATESLAIAHSRILCATHQGPSGRERINELGDERLRPSALRDGGGFAGRPVVLTRNLPSQDLWNGDLGVLLESETGVPAVLFARGDGFRLHPPERLEGIEPAWAITIHKSQGSEFDHVFLVLPEEDSPLLVRQILYTGLTRARRTLWIWGRKELWALGSQRRELRASRLREILGS